MQLNRSNTAKFDKHKRDFNAKMPHGCNRTETIKP